MSTHGGDRNHANALNTLRYGNRDDDHSDRQLHEALDAMRRQGKAFDDLSEVLQKSEQQRHELAALLRQHMDLERQQADLIRSLTADLQAALALINKLQPC